MNGQLVKEFAGLELTPPEPIPASCIHLLPVGRFRELFADRKADRDFDRQPAYQDLYNHNIFINNAAVKSDATMCNIILHQSLDRLSAHGYEARAAGD